MVTQCAPILATEFFCKHLFTVFPFVSIYLGFVDARMRANKNHFQETLHEKMDLLIFANEQICIKYDIY